MKTSASTRAAQASTTPRGDYLDIADVLLVTLDANGRVSHINQPGCRILGHAPEDVVGKDWFEHFIPESNRARVREVFDRVMSGEVDLVEHFENPVVTKLGTERLLAWHNAPVRLADGQIVGTISSGLDITHRRGVEQRQARLLKELTDLKFALDQSAIVAITDVAGRITYVNDTFCEVAKYTREELLGRDHRIVNSGHHPKAFFHDLWATIARGEIWRGEIRNRAKDGALYWVDTTIVPFTDADGKPYQYMAIRYEVTQRKVVEARLRHQETLARLGEMAAVVAHEVKNPLAGISGVLQVIGSRLPAGSDRAVIGDIQKRIQSLNDMVQDLLFFARPRPPAPSSTAIGSLLEDVASAVVHDPALSGVEIRVSGDNPTVRVDREQIRIVFQNLLINAAQAMGGEGRVDAQVRASRTGCVVTIADRGHGLTSETAERMFEPFYTTKHRGSGLGLPTARRIVEAHGGEITAESPDEGGTVLTISLPCPPLERASGTGRTS